MIVKPPLSASNSADWCCLRLRAASFSAAFLAAVRPVPAAFPFLPRIVALNVEEESIVIDDDADAEEEGNSINSLAL